LHDLPKANRDRTKNQARRRINAGAVTGGDVLTEIDAINEPQLEELCEVTRTLLAKLDAE